MRNHLTKLFALIVAGLAALSTLGAQSITDTMYENDVDAFNRKVKVTGTDLKKGSYIADYLRDLDRSRRNESDTGYTLTHKYSQEMLDNLIAQGASVEGADKYGLGPLYWACFYNNLGAVKSLIAAKANVNAKWTFTKAVNGINAIWLDESRIEYPDYFNMKTGLYQYLPANAVVRPLAIALFNSRPEIVQALLAAGADPTGTVYSIKGKSTVTESVFDQVCGMFAISKGKCDGNDGRDYVPLSDKDQTYWNRESIDRGRTSPYPHEFANGFLIWQAAMKLPSKERPAVAKAFASNIFAAACAGDSKAVKSYLSNPDFNITQFIPYSLYIGNLEYIDFILGFAGKTINDEVVETSDGRNTVLAYAFERNLPDTAIALLSHGVVLPPGNRGNDQLYYGCTAIARGDTALLKALLAAKLDLTAKDSNGYNLLAAAANSLEITTMLKDAGASLQGGRITANGLPSSSHSTDNFCYAVWTGNKDVVDYYLKNGVDLDKEDSPLFYAIFGRCPEVAQLLIDKGADVKALFESPGDVQFGIKTGCSVLDFAKQTAAADEQKNKNSRASADSRAVLDIITKAIAEYKDADHPFVLKPVLAKGSTLTVAKPKYPKITKKVAVSDFTAYSVMTINVFAKYTGKPAGAFVADGKYITASFYDAAALANDLSTAEGLTPVYVLPASDEARGADDAAISINKTANGYRLPTYAEIASLTTGAAGKEAQEWIYSMTANDKKSPLKYLTMSLGDESVLFPVKTNEPDETDPMPEAIKKQNRITYVIIYKSQRDFGAMPDCKFLYAGFETNSSKMPFFFVRTGNAVPAAK